MSENPVHSVRVHLGDMGRELLHLEGDMERSDWLLGFHAGASGKMPREGWSQARDDGFHFGACAFAEAVEYREGKSRAGSRSAAVRREAKGTAQPPNKPRTEPRTALEQNPEQRSNRAPNRRRTALEQSPEQTPNSARTALERCSNDVDEPSRTAPEQATEQRSNNVRQPEQRSNSARTEPRTALEQSPEQTPNQPTAYSLQPTAYSLKAKQPTTSEQHHRAREATTAPAKEDKRERWSKRRQAWIEEQGGHVDFGTRPGYLLWASYCRAVHPSWQDRPAKEAYDTLVLRNWTQGGRKIESWWQVADAWADNADQSEHFERLPMGSLGLSVGGILAAGIAAGESL